jgi:hypothetical protein
MSKEDKNKDGSGFSGDENNASNFGTPENYFDSFSSRLFSKIKANDELKDYPLLSGIEKKNPFVVPADYFEVKEELVEYALLRELKQKSFSAPVNYFETLPAVVLNKIAVTEEVMMYKALASIKKENVFALPANYFKEFAAGVKQIVSPAKVVSLYGRVLKQYKFAVAAAVLLLLAFAVILVNQKTEIKPASECNTFACLSKKEIINSGVLQNMSEESLIEMIDVKALSDSLSIKNKNGKTEKLDVDDVSDNIDVNTLTEEL